MSGEFAIETTHFQSWKICALLRGLGFTHKRVPEENVDVFTSEFPVECVYDGWTPNEDGSRLSSFEQLGDPDSPHYGRHYVTAFRFTGPGGYDNVLVWHSSSSTSGQLFAVIALGSYADWERMVAEGTYEAWNRWFHYNEVTIR